MDDRSTLSMLMAGFAERTGLTVTGSLPIRYLWTDAFAVCNFLELFRQTRQKNFLQQAISLVVQVHHVLGKHRPDESRRGWISGLGEEEGQRHPTCGGLRIGKPLPERRPDTPYDDPLEWERDGQYFHYLTKWMHALNCLARVTGDPVYNQWGVELAKTAHARFTYSSGRGGPKRLYWKMSIDLSYPLVHSMGQHDPLDGLITYRQLQTTAVKFGDSPASDSLLGTEIAEMAAICEDMTWATDDPLGIGELLSSAYRLAQLSLIDNPCEEGRLCHLLHDAEVGLNAFLQNHSLHASVEARLAFRELGLSIGLHAIRLTKRIIEQHTNRFSKAKVLLATLSALDRFHPLIDGIEPFWLEPTHQQCPNWTAHQEINTVMLATSLAPNGYLLLQE